MKMKNTQTMLSLIIILIIVLTSCDFPQNNNDNFIYTYPSIGDTFTIINMKTHQVDNEVKMDLPDGLQLYGLCISSDKNHLIFAGFDASKTENPICIVDYSISKDTIESIYNTGIQCLAVPRIGTAILDNNDSKVYLYTHKNGLYVIDFNKKETTLISSEIDVAKYFYTFDDCSMTIIKKYITSGFQSASYTEMEFYNNDSVLSHAEFILNQNDIDSVDVMDIAYSPQKNKIFITYLLSNGRSRNISAYFGSYDLETLEFSKGNFTFPWSTRSYTISNSDLLDECYVAGENDTVYVIDVSDDNYSMKDHIILSGKTGGPTTSILLEEENIAYFGCYNDNRVYIYNLKTRNIINQFYAERPYNFILAKK